ncbi:hypothetical protein MHYP_G00250210 [Metynnis hypsauchen]
MERSRVTLITLICVSISNISGLVVEMRVRPGDNVTIYCDCTWQSGFKIVWARKSSQEDQPPLIHLTDDFMLSRYSLVWNSANITSDLLVTNVTESDLGLYYCALHEKKISKDKSKGRALEDVYHYGNRTTFLSLLDPTVSCANLSQPTSTPPVSDCSVCWRLLVSVKDDVGYASLDIPSSGKKGPKKRTVENSLCTYSAVKADKKQTC